MLIYKIKRKDGAYSKGGTRQSFGPKGKIWTSKGALSNHFAQFNKRDLKWYNENCEIVEYELSETELVTVSISDYLEGVKERREKRDAPRKIREAQEEVRRQEAKLEAAKKVLREAGIKI